MPNLDKLELLDFTPQGYQCLKELGYNFSGGRKTYLGSSLKNNEQVVIKLFLFNINASDWSGFKALEKEAEALKKLNHERIPQYLDSFETEQGFCLVYRYIKGKPLSSIDLNASQVHEMTIALLEILVYLQSQHVIHRDIKPENIVLGEDGKYYLIDFGFSSIEQTGSLRASSVVAGTMGFMPIEQLFSKSVNQSTDLYALGVTLFCKLMNIRSSEVGKFIDSRVQLSTSELKQTINSDWLTWLDGLLKRDFQQRTSNAKTALAKLLDLSPAIQPSDRESISKKQESENSITIESSFVKSLIILTASTSLILFVISQTEFLTLDKIFSHLNQINTVENQVKLLINTCKTVVFLPTPILMITILYKSAVLVEDVSSEVRMLIIAFISLLSIKALESLII